MALTPETKPGDKILFNHSNVGTVNDRKNAKNHLTVGAQYTVLEISRRIFLVRVFLKEVPVISFPDYMFDNVNTTRYDGSGRIMGYNQKSLTSYKDEFQSQYS